MTNTTLVDLDMVGTALMNVRSTIKELTITAKFNWGNNCSLPNFNIDGSLTALVDFPRLERLEAPWEFLAASFKPSTGIQLKNIIPRNIQTLGFTDDFVDSDYTEWYEEFLYDLIAQLLQDQMAPRPSLRTIALQLNWTDGWEPGMRRQLGRLCAVHGIEASITKKQADRRRQTDETDSST
jgi:hypothetical protein